MSEFVSIFLLPTNQQFLSPKPGLTIQDILLTALTLSTMMVKHPMNNGHPQA